MKNKTFHKIEKAFERLIQHRRWVVLTVALLTAFMGYLASHVEVKTIFSDLLPKNHPYVEVNNRFKATFGGSNMVSIMLEVEQGDVFQMPVLERTQAITRALQKVEGIDTYQIVSLASKKLKEVRASALMATACPVPYCSF